MVQYKSIITIVIIVILSISCLSIILVQLGLLYGYMYNNQSQFSSNNSIQLQPNNLSNVSMDNLRSYDINKAFNPLEQPARRPSIDELPPIYFKRMIDEPTRGYPDNFTQFGILVKITDDNHDRYDRPDTSDKPNKANKANKPDKFSKKNRSNKSDKSTEHFGSNGSNDQILRLFGRQEFPGSNRYEYYTMIPSGFDQIKIPINSRGRRDELYDGDIVFIREIGNSYKVQLYDYDQPKYYPDLFY